MVGIELRMTGDGTSLKEDLDNLIKEHPAEVLYKEGKCGEMGDVSVLSDAFFRSYNIEHSGHDIKEGAK